MAQKGFIEPGEKPRRFYETVTVAETADGWQVLLDGRPPRSSRGAALRTPTRDLAELAAAEWEAQAQHVDLAAMHATRLVFTALEAIPAARESVADQIVQYAGNDLLCYPAESPAGLCARQAAAWGPVLVRARDELGVALVSSGGILHRDQPVHALEAVRQQALSAARRGLAGGAVGYRRGGRPADRPAAGRGPHAGGLVSGSWRPSGFPGVTLRPGSAATRALPLSSMRHGVLQ